MNEMSEKSYAKVNIFLKISNKRDSYHELVSRFVRVHSLYDTVSFIKSSRKAFDIIGTFGCKLETNTVYKAYKLLEKYDGVEDFFKNFNFSFDCLKYYFDFNNDFFVHLNLLELWD
mgnify:CR=1 FL=1